jgi:hypothetical protein
MTAVIISVVALLVALASVFYTAQQAAAAKSVANRDRERRHDERTPRLTVEAHHDQTWQRVSIVLDGPEDLDDLVLRHLPPRVKEAETGTLISTKDGTRAAEIDLGGVAVGQQVAAAYQVNSDERRGMLARFHVICRRGDEDWIVPVEVEFPLPPSAYVF